MSVTRRFRCLITDGRLPTPTQNALNLFLRVLGGKYVVVTVAEVAKRRSLKLNAFFHGPLLDQLEDFYRDAGSDMTREEIK